MSVLTKVFVVIVTFLSIALVALIVPFVAKTEDFRGKLQAEGALRKGAQASAAAKQGEIDRLKSGESERFTLLQAEKRELANTNVQLRKDLADSNSEKLRLASENAKRDADMSRLTAAAEQFGQITETQRQELAQRRGEAVAAATRILELDDRNNFLESQLDMLTRQVRRFKEGKEELLATIKKLNQGIAKLDPAIRKKVFTAEEVAGGEPFPAATVIQGQITGVESIGDDMYVQADLGQNDGVEVNMKFWIHRGGSYVGSIVIVKVDTDASAGRVMQVQTGVDVAVGDAVVTGTPDM